MNEAGRSLIVINGAIASGKSSVARSLAQLLERRGSSVAVIDLDEVWHMVDHADPRVGDLARWFRARRAAAALTDHFFGTGIDVVIVEGPFFTADERGGYVDQLRTNVVPRTVTLRVSFDVALRRARLDPTRGSSRDPEWLHERHKASEELVPALPGTDLLVETDGRTAEEVAAEVAVWLRSPDARTP